MFRLQEVRGVLLVIAATGFIFSLLPLGTALEFSPDEGFELMKGFLCSKGYALYKEIWSDQPPIYTLLLKWAFQTAGPSILVARLIAAGFGLLLFAGFFELVRQRSGQSAAAFATFFLIASPVVLLLSVAVMKEVAALGTALLSAWLLFQWSKQPHWGWLVASGVIMGLTAEIKFSALMVVPAALAEIALLSRRSKGQPEAAIAKVKAKAKPAQSPSIVPAQSPSIRRNMLIWVAGLLAVLTILGLTWSRGSLEISWRAHLTGHPIPGMQNRGEIRFPLSLLLDHGECALAAVVGIFLMARKQRWRELAFPSMLLLTTIAVHAVHRPWWDYYYLHLAIPMSWLAGLATAEILKSISEFLSKSRFQLGHAATWKGLVLCALTALALTRSLGRLEAGVKDLRERPKASANPVVAKMREYADRTRWAYAENAIYPFHARLLMPPELAVVTPKRFWSGQITVEDTVAVCRRRRVELLLLNSENIDPAWTALLQSEYSIELRYEHCTLYTVKPM